jgi:hypothetical protein
MSREAAADKARRYLCEGRIVVTAVDGDARPVSKAAIKDLWQAMVDAHPDKGGTDEQFIEARSRYEQAKVSA